MSQIPDWVLDEVRRRASIKDLLVNLFGRRAETGRYRCPFHEDKTPSLAVSSGDARREVFQCFGCGRSGDQIEFVKELWNIEGEEVTSFPKAVRYLAARLGIQWETQSQESAAADAASAALARRAEKLLALAINQAGTPEGALARERLDKLLARMGREDEKPPTEVSAKLGTEETAGEDIEIELPPIYDPPEVPGEILAMLVRLGHPERRLRHLLPERWHAYWTFGNGALGGAIKVLWPDKGARAMFYRLAWFRGKWRLAPGIRHGRFQPAGRDLLVRRKTGDVYLDPKSLLLYGCERLTPVPRTQWVVMPEGEKDADAWWRASGQKWPAVATHGGQSGRLNPYQLKQLEDRRVIVMGDLDEAGERYVERVRAALEGIAETIPVLGGDLAAAAGVDPEARASKGFDLSDALDRVSLDKLVAELGLPVGE